MTATKPKRSERIHELRVRLQQARDAFHMAVREIQNDSRFSDEYKSELIEAERVKHADDAKSIAARVWDQASKIRSELDTELAALSQEDDSWDYGRLEFLTREISSQLANARTDALGNNPKVSIISDLLERAQMAGDKHQLRALRTAAMPALNELSRDIHNGDSFRATTLARQLEEAAQTDVDRLRTERQMLENHHIRRLESDILETETVLTGARGGPFETVSPWEQEIFGRNLENTGRVVPPSGPAEPVGSEG